MVQLKHKVFISIFKNMIEIDLAGFLLTPIQRICKYPLQLQELLKTFENCESVYNEVETTFQNMKKLANEINERKRKHEERAKIENWQKSCQNWRGPNILDHSNRLVHSGEVSRSLGARRENRMGFLFDGQLLLVKPDNLRKNQCFYRERIDLLYCQPRLKSHAVELLVKDETGVELIRINLTFKKEEEKDKWFRLLNSEFERLSNHLNIRKNFHDFDRERPKSAVMVRKYYQDNLHFQSYLL